MPLEKRYLRIESPSGDKVFGSFIIGVPIAKVLELKHKYPDREFLGQDPRVDDAIKQDITEGEKRQICKYLHIPSLTEIKFEFQGIGGLIHETTKEATFGGENGKKFWVFESHRDFSAA
jgi:hypothetical protein